MNHFALRAKLLIRTTQLAYQQLQALKGRNISYLFDVESHHAGTKTDLRALQQTIGSWINRRKNLQL